MAEPRPAAFPAVEPRPSASRMAGAASVALRRARSGRGRSGPRPLLPARRRRTAVALVAACVAVIAVLGVLFSGQSRPDRFDAAVDAAVRSGAGAYVGLPDFLINFGNLPLVTVMTAALVLGCAAARWWRGAALAAVAVPAASGLTELVLKHLIGRTLHGWLTYPSGHATVTFALAAVSAILLTGPSCPQWPALARWLLMLGAFLTAAAVSFATVALTFHYFTDIVGGAALGTGTALLTALLVDRVATAEPLRAPRITRPGRP